mgnify:CR=1 FL=1
MSRTMVTLTREMQDDYGYNEAIKTLRTNILFCGSKVRVIMFTSSVPGEGKSDITLAAAQSMAQLGKKVLVIDGDIRRSVLVTRYQLKEKVNGLSQYLCGQKNLEDVIYDTSVENMSMIFAGPYSPNPAELLEEKLFTSLLEYARGEFEVRTIWDGPVCGKIPVEFTNVWENYEAPVKIEDGVQALYLTFCGEGTADLKSFTFDDNT